MRAAAVGENPLVGQESFQWVVRLLPFDRWAPDGALDVAPLVVLLGSRVGDDDGVVLVPLVGVLGRSKRDDHVVHGEQFVAVLVGADDFAVFRVLRVLGVVKFLLIVARPVSSRFAVGRVPSISVGETASEGEGGNCSGGPDEGAAVHIDP
jgi:hypothetical protein